MYETLFNIGLYLKYSIGLYRKGRDRKRFRIGVVINGFPIFLSSMSHFVSNFRLKQSYHIPQIAHPVYFQHKQSKEIRFPHQEVLRFSKMCSSNVLLLIHSAVSVAAGVY